MGLFNAIGKVVSSVVSKVSSSSVGRTVSNVASKVKGSIFSGASTSSTSLILSSASSTLPVISSTSRSFGSLIGSALKWCKKVPIIGGIATVLCEAPSIYKAFKDEGFASGMKELGKLALRTGLSVGAGLLAGLITYGSFGTLGWVGAGVWAGADYLLDKFMMPSYGTMQDELLEKGLTEEQISALQKQGLKMADMYDAVKENEQNAEVLKEMVSGQQEQEVYPQEVNTFEQQQEFPQHGEVVNQDPYPQQVDTEQTYPQYPTYGYPQQQVDGQKFNYAMSSYQDISSGRSIEDITREYLIKEGLLNPNYQLTDAEIQSLLSMSRCQQQYNNGMTTNPFSFQQQDTNFNINNPFYLQNNRLNVSY